MFNSFKKHNDHILRGNNLLLAVSGGIDSMVMLHLCQASGYQVGVAHIDHHTRDGQSTEDADFLRDYCSKHEIPFYLGTYNHLSGNFQSEARKYRYEFFSVIMQKNNYDLLLTAHHKDDLREGFLLSACRGASLPRLTSPRHQSDFIIRPLLFFDKSSIHDYARAKNLTWKDDQSNMSTAYSRNFIRHEILPRLNEHFSQSLNGLDYTIENLKQKHDLLNVLLHNEIHQYIEKSATTTDIFFLTIPEEYRFLLLIEYLSTYGFSSDQITQMLTASQGALFYANNWVLVKTHKTLRLQKESTKDLKTRLHIGEPGKYYFDNYCIELSSKAPLHTNFMIISPEDTILPLVIRYWKNGDAFYPKGMQGKTKKVKKFLTDKKVDRLTKKETLIVANQKRILWVFPYRQAETSYKDNGTNLYLSIVVTE